MKHFLFISLLFLTTFSYAQNTALRKGNDAYIQGDFISAKTAYLQALKANTNEGFDIVYYNLGNTFFKSGLFDQAVKSFDDAITSTKDTTLRANAFYNKGLTFIQQNKTAEAIDAFKNTLRLKPDDINARDNLQKALNSLPKKQNKTQPKKTPNHTNLSAQDAEQLLNKLHEKEMQLQKQLHKQNSMNKNVEKDW